jgi:hypothetical protein
MFLAFCVLPAERAETLRWSNFMKARFDRSLRLGAALFFSGFAAAALATPITYNFEGLVAPGQTVQGQFSFDSALMPTPHGFNSNTFNQFTGDQPAGQPAPFAASGTVNPGFAFVMGNGTASNEGGVSVSRNYCGLSCSMGFDSPYDEFRVFGRSIDLDGTVSLFRLYLKDTNLGSGTSIFDDPLGGLDPNQPINWFASGVTAYGMIAIGGYDAGSGSSVFDPETSQLANFTLTSITRQVPEPSTVGLMLVAGLGLLGTQGRRHRSQV